MVFYHGTTTHFGLKAGDKLLPAIETGNLREEWRKKLCDKVFLTTSPLSAYKFAKKAAEKYSGDAVVFIVKPIGGYLHINTNEYIASKAKIIEVYIPPSAAKNITVCSAASSGCKVQ